MWSCVLAVFTNQLPDDFGQYALQTTQHYVHAVEI